VSKRIIIGGAVIWESSVGEVVKGCEVGDEVEEIGMLPPRQ